LKKKSNFAIYNFLVSTCGVDEGEGIRAVTLGNKMGGKGIFKIRETDFLHLGSSK
jgi:hypothetical protein